MNKFGNVQENDKAVNPYALQESIRKSSVLWLTKQVVAGIIINSFNALPLYCDRANKGKEMSQKSLLMQALFEINKNVFSKFFWYLLLQECIIGGNRKCYYFSERVDRLFIL